MPLALLAAAAAAIATGDDGGWASFSAHDNRARTEVSIGTSDASQRPTIYWFRRSIDTPGAQKRVDQVDTRTCPRLLDALRALENLPTPKPAPPFLGRDEIWVTADGISYALIIPAAYANKGVGDMTLTSNIGTPLAEWIEQTLATFEVCTSAR